MKPTSKKIYQHNFTVPLILAVLAVLVLLVIYFSMGSVEKKPEQTMPEETRFETETQAESQTPKEQDKMPSIAFKSDLSAYEGDMNTNAEEYLILVNKQHVLSEGYEPSDLVRVKDAKKDITLRETAARALEAMFIEMRAEGYEDVFVTSAYRSYRYQSGLFQTYIEQEKKKFPTLTEAEARERVLRYSAMPGTSEHQSGLCVDLMTNRMSELDESFADEAVYTWLCENAWKFGFILRFPKDKTAITGYDYEPWHYRFVGRENAYEIWRSGKCLEEYKK